MDSHRDVKQEADRLRFMFWLKKKCLLQLKGLRKRGKEENCSAAAAKSLQPCPTLCDPIDSSPPGSPSLGFSRQEHWSGLPFPSPVQESEK